MQLLLILYEFAEFVRDCQKYGEFAVIYCGDFNVTPSSNLYDMLTNQVIGDKKSRDYYSFVSSLDIPHRCPFPFVSGYKYLTGSEPEYTNYTHKFVGCLDYAFHSTSQQIDGYKKTNDEKIEIIPTSIQLVNSTSQAQIDPKIPSKDHPSDHLPMLIEYSMKIS